LASIYIDIIKVISNLPEIGEAAIILKFEKHLSKL